MNKTGWLRVSGAVSCLILTLSILHPFLQVEWLNIMRNIAPVTSGPQTYWSFKVTYVSFTPPNHIITEDYWLQDYWSKQANYRTAELGLSIGAILPLMFIVQALTLLSAVLATLKAKPYLLLSAAFLSLFTTLCMWLTSRAFAYPYFKYTFQHGFWLTLAAATLFLTIFVAGQAKRVQPTLEA